MEGVSFKLANGEEINANTIQAKYNHCFDDVDEQTKENVWNAYTVMSDYLNRLQNP